MGRVIYECITTHAVHLETELKTLNMYQDKIVAVTQGGDYYTIFYERNGNDKDGDTDG